MLLATSVLSIMLQDGEVIGGLIGGLIGLAIALAFIIIPMWKVFSKAGKPGWASIVPIYNYFVMTEIAGRPAWWVILFFIPLVSLVIAIILFIDIARSFGKGDGFGIGMALLPFIFWPILGYGNAAYGGPSAAMKAEKAF